MALLVLAVFIIFIYVSYIRGKRDLLSPWFLLCLIMAVSYFIVILNYVNWNLRINGIFLLYVITAIISFGIGTEFVKAKRAHAIAEGKCLYNGRANQVSVNRFKTIKYPINLFLIVSVIFACIYIFKLFHDAGIKSSFTETIRQIYDNTIKENYSPGFLCVQMNEIVRAIAYLNTYYIFVHLYSKKKHKADLIKSIIPVIAFLGMSMIASDRNVFLRYAIYFVCMYVLFFRENYKKNNVNLKIIQKVIVLMIIVILLFFLLGKVKQYSSDITRAISIYGGSGLYDFNLWIKDFNGSLLFGRATFNNFLGVIDTVLGKIGINSNLASLNRFDSFITFASSNGYVYSSNIYSAMKVYVEDFGYFGVILFPFILGAFFEWLFIKMKTSKYGIFWILFCMLIYPIIYFPIDEQFFHRFHFGLVYEIFWVAILYYAVFGRKLKKKVRILRGSCNSAKKEVSNEKQ